MNNHKENHNFKKVSITLITNIIKLDIYLEKCNAKK